MQGESSAHVGLWKHRSKWCLLSLCSGWFFPLVFNLMKGFIARDYPVWKVLGT